MLLLIANSTSACEISDIKAFANDIASSYKSGTMDSLDNKHVLKSPLEVTIEHSLIEDTFEKKTFKNFKSIQSRLASRESDGLPQREIRKLKECSNGKCSYDFYEGIFHNTLYLYDLKYSGKENCATLLAIHLFDGD